MTTINQLSAVDALVAGDLLAVYDMSNGDQRKAALSALTTFLNSALTFPVSSYTSQVATVNVTAYEVNAQDSSANIWLFINMAGDYAAGAVVFPATPVDGQEVLFKWSHDTTTLTMYGNGKTIVGGLTTMTTPATTYRYKYDTNTTTWYQI